MGAGTVDHTGGSISSGAFSGRPPVVPHVVPGAIPAAVPAVLASGVPAAIPSVVPPTRTGDPRYANLLSIPWTVQVGQTIESLAASLSDDPETIRGINGITTLVPGQRIRIPIDEPTLCCD